MTSATVIIVSYNSEAVIAEAMEALAPAAMSEEIRCIVVDNASQDHTVPLVRERFPWATVIESGQNLGYGRGMNLGLKHVTTPYVVFMNPDALLTPPNLRTLIRFMDRHPEAGAVAPAITQEDGSLQEAGTLPTPWNLIKAAAGHHVKRSLIVPGADAFRTDWLCGAILLVRRCAVEPLNGFDPRFFLYFEETDLCRRMLRTGWELWAIGEAVASHVGGASARQTGRAMSHGCMSEHYYRSRFYYLCKHHGVVAAAAAELADFALARARERKSLLFKRGTIPAPARRRLFHLPDPVSATL